MNERIVSHFRLDQPLGEGGMGMVWEATDLELERSVAIKLMRPESLESEDRRARFLREARTAAKVTHPNLATIYEIGEHEGEIFLAMELIKGRTLRETIAGRPMPAGRVLSLASQIAEGLTAAHAAGVIHRDLKPENVMVDAEGRAKLLDFGLAKLLDDGPMQDGNVTTAATMAGVTRDGRILGTVAYMSPEQARGRPVDARTDIFSFGVILYEMSTGLSPFAGETPTDTLTHILRDDPPPAYQHNPSIPAELARVIQRCLEKDPADRYPDSKEMSVELRMLLRQSESGSLAPASGSSPELLRVDSGDLPAPPPSASTGPVPPPPPPGPAKRRGVKRAWILGVAILFFAIVSSWPDFSPLEDRDRKRRADRAPDRPTSAERAPRPAAPRIADHTLAVMPFRNLADEVDSERLGQILQELIITDLSGSERLRIFSSQRMQDLAEQLSGGEPVTWDRETANRIAREAGAQTLMDGTLSRLGEQWIVTAQLVDAESGTVVGSQRVDGDDLYAMVDELTDRLREEPRLALGGATDDDVRDRTSSSLEAQRLYLAGVEALDNGEHGAAAAVLEQAVEADPGFGQAWYKLSWARWWDQGSVGSGVDDETVDPLRLILDGDVRATPKDTAMAAAALSLFSNDWEEAITRYERLTQEYSDEKESWYGLGEALYHAGRNTRPASLPAFEEAIALDPGFTLAYEHVFELLFDDDDFAAIVRHAKTYVREHPEDQTAYRYWARAAAADGNEEEVTAAIQAMNETLGEGRGERILRREIHHGEQEAAAGNGENPFDRWDVWDEETQSLDEGKLERLLKDVAGQLPGAVQIEMGDESDPDSDVRAEELPDPPDPPER